MDRFDWTYEPTGMMFPYTFSFPLIRRNGMPREFRGQRFQDEVTDSLYTADFEYFLPPYR